MKVKFLKNAFERNKKIPSIYRKGEVYDLADADAKFYVENEKAEPVKEKKADADTDAPKAPAKTTKKADADK